MGLRGPGAKPVKKAEKTSGKERKRRPSWQKRGLSRAQRVIEFVERLPMTSGVHAGTKMTLRPWQRDIVKAIYATDDNGLRHVRTALLTMPRKNGKTQLSAALCLAHLIGPEAEARGQCYSAAADRAQAALLFSEMKAIILAVPEFAERCIIRDFNKQIEDAQTGSIYLALSADAKTKHGFNASFIVYDELAQAPNRHLYDVLTTSTAARAEPLAIVISTQSPDPHHVMSELVDYGGAVNDGVIEDASFHATTYAAPDDADPWAEETWRACNPALGDFRSLEELRTAAMQAQRIPARESAFRNLYLNQRVEADARFIAAADWDACTGGVDPESLRGRPCWAGLDLGSTRDLTALVLYFPDDDGAILPFFWVPGDNLAAREDNDKVPYRAWAKAGHIEATSGRAIDRLAIVRRLAEIAAMFDVQGIAYDRWRMEDLKKMLADEGIDLPMVDWGQGFKDMGPAVDATETAILDAKLRHPANPVLTWNVANAVISSDPAGARKVDKQRARERVDGLVALVMAVGLHSREPAPQSYDFDRPMVLSA